MSAPISLPNELWIRILQNLNADDDLPFLYVTCRHVNSVFRDAVESSFRERLLPKLRINFSLGDYSPPMQNDRRLSAVPLACEFEFQRLLEDGQTAILGVEELSNDLMAVARKRMRYSLLETRIEIPCHSIQIRRDITDGPIPRLSFDSDKLEMSCDWRALFTAFYGEEFLYHSLLGKAVEGRKPWLEELKAKVDRKEMEHQHVIMKALDAFATDDKSARKTARRARIKKQWSDIDPEWSFARDGDQEEETRVLKSLQQQRQWASFEEWSDEEEEDGEEDEDSDENVGSVEGWETEDDQEWESDAETDE